MLPLCVSDTWDLRSVNMLYRKMRDLEVSNKHAELVHPSTQRISPRSLSSAQVHSLKRFVAVTSTTQHRSVTDQSSPVPPTKVA